MKNPLGKGNWWLRLLALALAIATYYLIRNDAATGSRNHKEHDRNILQSR